MQQETSLAVKMYILGQDGETPLFTASYRGYQKVVQHLLARGANPNIQKTVRAVTVQLYMKGSVEKGRVFCQESVVVR